MYRINELIKQDRKIYHTNDLAILWGITNRNTLYTAIKRYVQRGVLIPIYKGLYATLPICRLEPLDLGRAVIHRYAYLSTESVLFQAGVILQAPPAFTFVSDQSRQVSLAAMSFLFRQLKDKYLHHPAGILKQKSGFTATPERAAADMLYFDPAYCFDVPERIDFEKVKLIQNEVGYPC